MAAGMVPAPRNFRCAATMASLSDGQLFWVIENGADDGSHATGRQGAQNIQRPGRRARATAMQAHREYLGSAEIWQLVLHIRTLSDEGNAPRPDRPQP